MLLCHRKSSSEIYREMHLMRASVILSYAAALLGKTGKVQVQS